MCKGQYDKAIADYTKAIHLDPRCAAAYFGRGSVYGYKGEYDKAIADDTERPFALVPTTPVHI